jgi:D-sedoheptulose 7-phosphate isomerase
MGSAMTPPDAPVGPGARSPAAAAPDLAAGVRAVAPDAPDLPSGAPALAADAIDAVRRALADAVAVQRGLEALAAGIAGAAAICWTALAADRRVLVFGNGGSAAEAQHFAAELSGRFARERRALPALALTTDTSVLTAVGNDYGFERVFGRQVEAFGRPGDVAVGISTSGRSPNVVDGLRTARARGLTTIAIAGASGAELAPHADLVLAVAGPSTARIQEGHLTVLHVICDLVESALVASEPPASR